MVEKFYQGILKYGADPEKLTGFSKRNNTRKIVELQSDKHLYHATFERRLQQILKNGINKKFANKMDGKGRYQCLTRDLSKAIYFAHHVHLMFGSSNQYIGVIRVDPSKLSKRIREQLGPDPLSSSSIITHRSISPNSFDQLILVDWNRNDLLKISHEINRKKELESLAIDYDLATRKFDFKN